MSLYPKWLETAAKQLASNDKKLNELKLYKEILAELEAAYDAGQADFEAERDENE